MKRRKNTRIIEGKSWRQWAAWFAIRGVEKADRYFRDSHYWHGKKGWSDEAIVAWWKAKLLRKEAA